MIAVRPPQSFPTVPDEPHSPERATETFDLVVRAQAGSNEALGALLERYSHRVRKVVRLRLGEHLRRFADSTDILQDVFVAALRTFARFEPRSEASVINWLSKIAENAIRSLADKAKRQGCVSLDPHDTNDWSAQLEHDGRGRRGPAARPDEAAAARDETERIEQALAALDGKYREVIVLRDYVGCSWAEVALELGRPSEDAARMLHAKAVLELDRELRRRATG